MWCSVACIQHSASDSLKARKAKAQSRIEGKGEAERAMGVGTSAEKIFFSKTSGVLTSDEAEQVCGSMGWNELFDPEDSPDVHQTVRTGFLPSAPNTHSPHHIIAAACPLAYYAYKIHSCTVTLRCLCVIVGQAAGLRERVLECLTADHSAQEVRRLREELREAIDHLGVSLKTKQAIHTHTYAEPPLPPPSTCLSDERAYPYRL